MDKPTYNVEEATYFPTYSIIPVQDVHLRSGKVLHKYSSPIIEEQTKQWKQTENSHPGNQIQKGKTIMTQTPPYPKRLVEQKIPMSLPEFDILDELKNAYVKIPLLQDIKYIPIYEKQ